MAWPGCTLERYCRRCKDILVGNKDTSRLKQGKKVLGVAALASPLLFFFASALSLPPIRTIPIVMRINASYFSPSQA